MTAAFVNLWNSHNIKSQNNLQLPNGVPTNMLYFLEHGGTQNGIQVTNKLLQEAFTHIALTESILQSDTTYFLSSDWSTLDFLQTDVTNVL